MKAGVIVAVIVGAVAIIFLAVNRGLISSGVNVGFGPAGSTTVKGIIAPQPTQNYSGFLAASTAPGVATALNGALAGLGKGFESWFGGGGGTQPVAQGASATSPSLFAQPSGPSAAAAATVGGSLVGPIIDPAMSYDMTTGAAYDYSGLSADNTWDSSATLDF